MRYEDQIKLMLPCRNNNIAWFIMSLQWMLGTPVCEGNTRSEITCLKEYN